MWEKVRGVFLMSSNGKNAMNFFPHLILIYKKCHVIYLYHDLKNNLKSKYFFFSKYEVCNVNLSSDFNYNEQYS